MNNNRTKLILAPLAASALIFSLAACGSDDNSSSTATTATATESTDMATESTDMATENTDMAAAPVGEATVGDITVSDVWTRKPAEGQTNSAIYGVITNNGDADVTFASASVTFAATVQIHETTTDADGKMQMQEVPGGFVVPAGGSFTLEPGGAHIMLIDVDRADIGEAVDVTLMFDDGTEVMVSAPVRSVDATEMGGGMTETTMGG